MKPIGFIEITRSPDGGVGGVMAPGTSLGGAAGGGAAPSPANPISPNPISSNPGAMPGSGGWAAPEFLPQALRGMNESETFGKVAEDWRRQRDLIGKLPAAAQSAADFTVELSERAKAALGDLSSDPMFAAAKEAAFKAGMPPGQFKDMMGGLFNSLAEQGVLPKPIDQRAEVIAALGERGRNMSDKELNDAIVPMHAEASHFRDGLARTGALDAASLDAVNRMMDTGAGLRAIVSMARAANANAPGGPNPGGQASGQNITKEQLNAMVNDPRAVAGSPNFDPAFHATVEQAFKNFYGA